MNPLGKLRFLRNKHGSAMAFMVIGMVVTVITVIIGIMVALLITGQLSTFSSSLNYYSGVNSTVGNTTAQSLFTNTFSALSLSTIEPFILVASLIIATVTSILGVVAYRRER